MLRKLGAVLFLVVGLSFASEAFSRVVAYSAERAEGHLLVLTDQFNDICPIDSNIAVILDSQDEALPHLIGCWKYDDVEERIYILWLNDLGEDPFITQHKPDIFIKVPEKLESTNL